MGKLRQDMKDYPLKDLYEKVTALMEKAKQLERTQEIHTNEIEELKDKLRGL